MEEPSDADIVADIKRVAALLSLKPGEMLSRQEYREHGGKFSHYHLYDGGRAWKPLCAAAGFSTKEKVPVSDDIYFEKLAAAVRKLGRYPKTSERKRFGLSFHKSRFPTLTAFIERAIELGHVEDLRPKIPAANETPPKAEAANNGVGNVGPPEVRPIPPIPAITRRRKWERTGITGLPYAPQDELIVVALFGILCANGTFNWEVLEMNGGKGIDATCFDHGTGREIRVELKHTFSRGSWNHSIDELDYVVCWENRWKDFPKPVIELREVIRKK
jgi:hypothetical protein